MSCSRGCACSPVSATRLVTPQQMEVRCLRLTGGGTVAFSTLIEMGKPEPAAPSAPPAPWWKLGR